MKHAGRVALIIAIITAGIPLMGANKPIKTPDAVIAEYIVGSWVVDPKDEYYATDGAISTYKEDGTVAFEAYFDVACERLNFRTSAKWHVSAGYLYITVVSSERPDIHPPGYQVVDFIHDINSRIAVHIGQDGSKQLRIRSTECISNEI